MTAHTDITPPTAVDDDRLDIAEVVRVRLPEKSIRADLRATKIVWKREMIRFFSDKLRIVTALLQPLLFLFVLGTGFSSLTRGSLGEGISFRTFMFPGALAMAVLFTAMFSAGSIVWDREFGFLREMLVAPVSRWSLVLGKCLGGATVATFQGVIILAMAGLAGVPYDPVLFTVLTLELLLLSFALTAFGTMMAARMTSMQGFMAIMQMCTMPLFFLSGALFPLAGLPAWLSTITHLNPLTYAVDPLRQAVFGSLDISPEVREQLAPGIAWGGWEVPIWFSLTMVSVFGIVCLLLAVVQFRKAE
jgi:daunorubicin resistance ABC transporter membrane protein